MYLILHCPMTNVGKGSANSKFQFEAHYKPLRDLLASKKLNGLDLDIEEPTSLSLTTKLLHRLSTDFGPSFILTLAPVMPALLPLKPYLAQFCYRLLHPELPTPTPLIGAFIKASLLPSHSHMSGFNHFELESSEVGRLVRWYNVQFYCGWGDAGDERLYDAIVACGWDPRKVVLGVVSNPENGSGFVDVERLGRCIGKIREKHGNAFGGVMGWEYFNAGGMGRPEEWVRSIAKMLGRPVSEPPPTSISADTTAIPRPTDNAPVPAPTNTADIQAALQQALLLGRGIESALSSAPSLADANTETLVQEESLSLDAEDEDEDEAKVQRLVEMGFDRAEAEAALDAMDGDVDAAAAILFGD